MRFFTTFLIAATFVFSANANISADVALCISDLVSVSAQLDIITSAVNNFYSTAGYSGVVGIHNLEQVLETRLNNANSHCCVNTGVNTIEETSNILDVFNIFVTEITSTLSSYGVKKPEFDAVILATSIVRTDLKAIKVATGILNTCLINKTPSNPPDLMIQLYSHIANIDQAFFVSKSIYNY